MYMRGTLSHVKGLKLKCLRLFGLLRSSGYCGFSSYFLGSATNLHDNFLFFFMVSTMYC